MTFKSDLFRVALIDISLSSSDVSDETIDFLFNNDKFLFVDLNFLLKLQLEISSSNVGVDLIFLSLGDLTLNGGFKVVKELKKFSLNLNPSLSLAVLECIKFEVSLVVINVTRSDFIRCSSLNISVDINVVLRAINEVFLKLNEFSEVTTSVDGKERC